MTLIVENFRLNLNGLTLVGDSDMERYMYIFTILGSEDSHLLCLTIFFLQ